MRFRLRISRAILFIFLSTVFIAIGVEVYFSYSAFQHDALFYAQHETDTAYAIANALQQRSLGPSSANTHLIPSSLQSLTNSLRLAILKPDGTILEDQPAGQTGQVVPQSFTNQVLDNGLATQWKSGGNILITGIALTLDGRPDAAVLIREVDLSRDMAHSWQDINARILTALLMGAIVGLLVFYVSWRLTIGPMKEMQGVAEKIFAGDMSPRVSPLALIELDQIGGALNRMLDRFQNQHTELEELNRSLETTVKERTSALESANTNLNRQTRGLRLVNSIVDGGTNSANLDEFCEKALLEIVHNFDAASGLLTIQGSTALFPGVLPGAKMEANGSGAAPPVEESAEVETRSKLLSPVYGQEDIFGQIEIGSPRENNWSGEDRDLLNLIGQQLGVAAERIRAYQKSRETNWMMARLISSSEQLNQHFHQSELFPIIVRGILGLAAAQRGAILVINSEDQIEAAWSIGISQRFIHNLVEMGLEGDALSTRRDTQPILIYNIEQLPPKAQGWWQETSEGIESALLTPLIYEGKISAYAACFYDQPGLPGLAHVEILEAFARQAATSLENTRLIEAERQQHVLAEALRDVSAALTSTLDSDEVFERILVNLGRVVQHDAASIMMIESDNLHVIRGSGYPTKDGHPEKRTILVNSFPHVAEMVTTGQAVIIPNTFENPGWVVTPETSWMQSYAGAPVCARGKVIGIINLIGRAQNAFRPSQVSILRTFADQAAIAIENARLFQATRRKMMESTTLYLALTGLLSPGGEMEDISARIVHNLRNLLNVNNCGVHFIDHELNLIYSGNISQVLDASVSALAMDGPGLIAAAARSGEVLYAPDVTLDARYIAALPETRSELCIPLLSGGKPFAILNVEHSDLDAFDAETRQTLISFAERASLVLENARLLEAAREQSRCTELLNEIAQASLENSDIYAALEQIVRQIAELVKASCSYITLWDDNLNETVPLVSWGPGTVGVSAQNTHPGIQQLTTLMMQTGQALAVTDTQAPQQDLLLDKDSSLSRSVLGVPLITGGRRMGAILAGYQEKHLVTRREIGLLEQAAVQIALGMAKIQLLETTRKRAEESERLRQATAALTTQLDFDEVTRRISQHLPSLIRYDSLAVFIVRDGMLKPVVAPDFPGAEELLKVNFPLDAPLFTQMTQTRQPVVLPDAQQDSRFQNWGKSVDIHSWMGVPLFAGDKVVGNISLGRFELKPFLADEVLLVQVFANQAGAALQNALLHAREQQLAITDPLTGLYNRRGFQNLARHELERSWRFGRPLSLMIMDIDRFKLVNDTYGHSSGDDVLRELSQRIQNAVREVDLICRYGGEEFCVILPESDPKGAFIAAERLRQSIEQNSFTVRAFSIPITISIGLANMTSVSQTLEELIEWADAALLRSKAEGRNRVSVAQIANMEFKIRDD